MADNFAMGNALMTFGQASGNAINNYFNEQINAAQHAQEMTLKQMELQSNRDEKQQTFNETHRHNIADETNAQARTEQEAKNQAAERTQAATNAADTEKYRGQEISLRGAEVSNQARNINSEIAHRGVEETQGQERINNEGGKGTNALKAGEELQSKELKQLQEDLKKNNPTGSKILNDDQQKAQDDIQKKITQKQAELAHTRAELTKAGKLNAPLGGSDQAQGGVSQDFSEAIGAKPPAAKAKPSAGEGKVSLQGKPTKGAPEGTLINLNGQHFRAENGIWVPSNG